MFTTVNIMFQIFLLTAVVGAGAANIPAPDALARLTNPPSYLCSSVNNKCAQAKQLPSVTAYCSSYLHVPKTATKTVSKCSTTTTTTTTQYTATVTQPGATVTSTVTACARPSAAPGQGEPALGTDAGAPAPAGKRDAAPEAVERYDRAKPLCLSAYNKANDLSTACGCLSLKPHSTTTRTIVTATKTATRTVKTASTVQGEPTTTTILGAAPTFAIWRENDAFYVPRDRSRTPNIGLFQPNAPIDRAILFQLNNPGGLTGQAIIRADGSTDAIALSDGQPLGVLNNFSEDEQPSPEIAYQVRFRTGSGTSGLTPLTCSISLNPTDGTCPLDCKAVGADDTNQFPRSMNWYLGPPGAITPETFRTFAVTIPSDDAPAQGGNFPQPGPDVDRGSSGGGNKKRR